MSSNRRVTLGPVTTAQLNARGAELPMGGSLKGSRRMSVGPTPRMSMGPGMNSMAATIAVKEALVAAPAPAPAAAAPVGARRMSMEAAPAGRRASVGVSRCVHQKTIVVKDK